jgi:uncharacterized protein YcbK (DUF882 family)
MTKLSAHFDSSEMQCPHCRECFIRPKLIMLLERMRAAKQVPVPVVSGYRCPVHNHAVGGAKNSQHVMGAAADIRVPGLTLSEALQFGFTGVGTKDGIAVHVDVRDGGPVHWIY